MMARTCTNNLRVVFSPYVKHCQCEASEQKWGQKTNIWNKEIELRIWFHSIRLNELVILVCSFVKIWWKMAKLWPWEARAPKWRWPILGHKMAILATFFEIWTSNLFCPLFTLILIYKPRFESIRPKSAILSPKKLQKLTKVAISQNPISPKCHSPKSLLLLHFSTNLSETFRINVNMDFAHTNHGRFLI